MSSPFAFLQKSTTKVDKLAKEDVDTQVKYKMIEDTPEARDELYWKRFEVHSRRILSEIEKMKRMKEIICSEFNELITGTDKPKQNFMITIRPKDNMVNIEVFKEKISKLVRRACFIEWTYSFEQKGTCPEDLGKGFHVHIVAQMKQRSKSEVLRDITTSFNDWIRDGIIESNCIDVCVTKNPESLVQNYLIDYKSDDDHKEPTKVWDGIWKEHNSLQDIYRSDMCPNATPKEP